MDKHITEYYNNQLPKQDKKKAAELIITSPQVKDSSILSNTVRKTSKHVPLILYWSFDYRHTVSLNPAIGFNYFKKVAGQQFAKWPQKQNGEELTLSITQLPSGFALVSKEKFYLFVVHSSKIYVEPDTKDMVVAYQLKKDGIVQKEGAVTVKNTAQNQGIRYAQSWKSSSSEFLDRYQIDINAMAKQCMEKVLQEIKE